jgi:uncharacterized membrane protein YdbT with pleckstrin-like domain
MTTGMGPSQPWWLTKQMLAIQMQTSISMKEVVKYTGRLHSVVFLRRALMILPFLAFAPTLLAIAVGSLCVCLALLEQASTKIIVTNRRVIIRRGMRRTVHINIQQIESIDVTQSYLGMILNYGTVTICGSGGSRERVEAIADAWRIQDRFEYTDAMIAQVRSD